MFHSNRQFSRVFVLIFIFPCWLLSGSCIRTSGAGCMWYHNVPAIQGWGLISQFPPFRYFPNFSALSKHTLANEYHVYIRQVSPQLSCGDTCQIWMWCQECSMYFCHIKNFPYGEINERSFSTPHPRSRLLRLTSITPPQHAISVFFFTMA